MAKMGAQLCLEVVASRHGRGGSGSAASLEESGRCASGRGAPVAGTSVAAEGRLAAKETEVERMVSIRSTKRYTD